MKKLIISNVIVCIIAFTSGLCIGNHCPISPRGETNSPIEESVDITSLTEWQKLELALIKTESDFNPLAVGKSKDIGILQMIPIYVEEVNRISGKDYLHEDAFSPSLSIEMFNIMQSKYNPNKSIIKAIQLHNPGGESIGYTKRVLENLDWITKYEDIRKLVQTHK